ncbi:MAG: hypothetical protein R3338_09450, partial [Thermoanaerobaculia bacterium]|nr:hypothetical protein [Thermoanaerobaculia bacterium]
MTRRIAIGVAIGVAILALAVGGAFSFSGDISIPTWEVERTEFVRTVTADGNLKAAESTPLGAPPDAPGGLKIAWLEKDGAPVSKGDVVVRFDPTEFEDALISGTVESETIENR